MISTEELFEESPLPLKRFVIETFLHGIFIKKKICFKYIYNNNLFILNINGYYLSNRIYLENRMNNVLIS